MVLMANRNTAICNRSTKSQRNISLKTLAYSPKTEETQKQILPVRIEDNRGSLRTMPLRDGSQYTYQVHFYRIRQKERMDI